MPIFGKHRTDWWGFLIGVVMWWLPAVGHTQAPLVQMPHLRVGLISEVSTAVPGHTFWIGVYQKIDPKWHTYWQNPGDSGLPPNMVWRNPNSIHVSKWYWPLPNLIRVKHLANYGYEQEALLLAQVTIPQHWSGSVLRLSGDFSWLICKEECIPGKTTLSLEIPVRPGKVVYDRQRSELFRRFRRTLPHRIHTIRLQTRYDGHLFHLKFTSLQPNFPRLRIDGFFSATEGVLNHADKPRISRTQDALLIQVKKSDDFVVGERHRLEGLLMTSEMFGAEVERTGWWVSSPILASPTSNPAIQRQSPGSASSRPGLTASRSTQVGHNTTAPTHPSSHPSSGLPKSTDSLAQILHEWRPWQQQSLSSDGNGWNILQAILFALLGGIILNLMPCVFPVLSIKILHFVQQARSDPREVRHHGLVFAAGVLVSFSALALLIVALRLGGEKIGWGFQLQVPAVVFVLALVLFLLGLSLSGLFTLGSSLMNVGEGLASRSGLAGSFFTGVLATVVATPCTAPLMGAAIAFALVQPVWVSLLVFNALGAGMALPYVLLACFPAALRWLPRPGLWMERIKQVMAFPMYAAAIWLLWVLGKQAGRDGMTTALVAFLGVALACWLLSLARPEQLMLVIFAWVVGLSSVGWGVSQLNKDAQTFATQQAEHKKLLLSARPQPGEIARKQPYRTRLLGWHLQQQHNVLLNLTADWCISCKVNEKVALQTQEVLQAMRRHRVFYLVGDWTHRDPEITKTLEFFGRNGVPLYVLFHGTSRRYQFLPQILTPGMVTDALAQFSKP